jgi:hypothetical protein
VQPPPLPLRRETFQGALCAVAEKRVDAAWTRLAPDGTLRRQAERLAAEKYSQARYNQNR